MEDTLFNSKNDYARNKLNPDTIVYASATGWIKLSKDDFTSEDEFLKWKHLSDKDYHDRAKQSRQFDNCLSLECLSESSALVCSAEEMLIEKQKQPSPDIYELNTKIREILTDKQYRRLYLYSEKHMNQMEIAVLEGVLQCEISVSINQAKKKIKNFLRDIQ